VKGILADVNTRGPVDDLVREMRSDAWGEFWIDLGLVLFHFEDVGLTPTSTDLEIWRKCQDEQLLLITNNRNNKSPDSLEATIQQLNTPGSLPVFTIADLDSFRKSRAYAERVLKRLYEHLLNIDTVRGTGRPACAQFPGAGATAAQHSADDLRWLHALRLPDPEIRLQCRETARYPTRR
jgi:hypothetical protein